MRAVLPQMMTGRVPAARTDGSARTGRVGAPHVRPAASDLVPTKHEPKERCASGKRDENCCYAF